MTPPAKAMMENPRSLEASMALKNEDWHRRPHLNGDRGAKPIGSVINDFTAVKALHGRARLVIATTAAASSFCLHFYKNL